MDHKELVDIICDIDYKPDWWFCIYADDLTLQVKFKDSDGVEHSCRKWRISKWMTKSEVVQTALKAILSAEEHEAREKFTYKGKAIFGPHIDVDKLTDICDYLDVRN